MVYKTLRDQKWKRAGRCIISLWPLTARFTQTLSKSLKLSGISFFRIPILVSVPRVDSVERYLKKVFFRHNRIAI
jgi:hypothetical protein